MRKGACREWLVLAIIALLFTVLALANRTIHAQGALASHRTYFPAVHKFYPPIPATPLLLPIENSDGDGNYIVRWNAAARAQSYELEEKWQNLNWFRVYQGPAIETELRHRAPGDYAYRCRAHNSWGDSEWSNVQTVKVQGVLPGEMSTPSSSSTNASGKAVVKVVNDCPYILRLDFAGPQPQLMELPKCDVCHTYSFIGPIFCPTEGRPTRETQIAPGEYRVFVTVDNPAVRPYFGRWTLLGNRRYFVCFYILTRYTAGEAVLQAELCGD